MPMYVYGCEVGPHEVEGYYSINDPAPECCGAPMVKRPQAAGSAFLTRAGNWFNRTAAAGPVFYGGGRPKPKVIGNGHGIGGHRPNPTIHGKQLPQKPRSMP